MAGTLPGVESARRRRFHQSGGFSESAIVAGHGLTRRSSLCLYGSKHESYLSSSSYSLQRNILHIPHQDEKLGRLAREAKGRLDEKFRNKRINKSETTRHSNSRESLTRVAVNNRTIVPPVDNNLRTEVFGLKKSGSKRFMSWAKFNWKASDQDECAVCLEKFKPREVLVHLPCAHRFHSGCLEPWLENNAHCPCCRMGIILP